MLKKVRITNFLSCQDTEIEFDNITALIGRNAAGKTNILKAIRWCARFAVSNEPFNHHLNVLQVLKRKCSIEFLIGDKTFKYEVNITINRDKNNISLVEIFSYYASGEWKLVSERSNGSATHYSEEGKIDLEINCETPMISSLISLLPQSRLNSFINKAFKYLSEIKYYILEDDKYKNGVHDDFAGFVHSNSYKQWISTGKTERSLLAMKLLHLWHENKEILDEIQALIGKNGLNLIDSINIDEINPDPTNEDYFYIIKFNIANTTVNYSQLSYGTQRVLVLLLVLLYDKNSTLLIEQPEDGIHTGLLHKLLPLCFEYAEVYNKQLIITTHSSEAINLFQPENIRIVKMTEDGTKVSSLDKERMPFIREYLQNEGALFDFIDSMDDE